MNVLLRSLHFTLTEIQNSFRGGSVSLFMGIMSANVIAYGYHTVIARSLPPADYGALVTLTSISYALAVLGRTLQAWVIKATCNTESASSGHLRLIFGAALRVVILLGSLTLLVHWLASPWVADFLRLQSTIPVFVLGVYAFTAFLTPLPRGVLLGLNRLHLAGAIYALEAVARFIAGIVLVSWGLGTAGALASYAVGELLAFVIALVPLWSLLRTRGAALKDNRLRVLDGYGAFVLVTNILLVCMTNIDQITVKHFFSEHVAGNYAVAFLLGRIIAMSTMALGWTIFARAATLPIGDPKQARLFIKGLLVTGLIAGSLMLGYIAEPAIAIRLMGGAQYEMAHIYVGLVGIEMTLFAFVYIQVYFLMSLKQTQIVWPLLVAFGAELILLTQYHRTVEQILWSLIAVIGTLCCYVSVLSWSILCPHSPVVPVPQPGAQKNRLRVAAAPDQVP